MPNSKKQSLSMQEKREMILSQALLLFSEHGYNDTTIQKIAKASKVSFGSVFTYFESKDALFHAVIAEPLRDFATRLLDFDTETDQPIMELKRMVQNHLVQFARMGDYLRVTQQVIGQRTRFPESFAVLRKANQKLIHKVAQLIERGQEQGLLQPSDPHKTAITYTSFLIGLRLNITEEPESPVWSEFLPCAIQIFGPRDGFIDH